MAAGLGFKTFTTGEVLTAADTNGYLMQGILVFASAAARDAAITSPQEGQFAYLKDTNVTTYYTGSAWANVDTTGMTNPMTTTGDIIYSSPGSTPVRLGIGTANQVLQVNSGATAPEWATASSGGMTLISTTTLSGATVTLSSIPQTFVKLQLLIFGMTGNTGNAELRVSPNAVTNLSDQSVISNSSTTVESNSSRIVLCYADATLRTDSANVWNLIIENYKSTTNFKPFNAQSFYLDQGSVIRKKLLSGCFRSNTAVSSIVIDYGGTNTFAGGTALLYGVK